MAAPLLNSKITDKLSFGSLLNTVNPLSNFTGGQDYVAPWLINLFRGPEGSLWLKNGSPAKAAHLLSKVVLGGGVAAATVWGLRSLLHSMKIDNLQDMSPAASPGDRLLDINYSRPSLMIAYTGTRKKKKDNDMEKLASVNKKAADTYNMALSTLPPALALLAIATSMKHSDMFFDKKLGKHLDKQIQLQRRLSDKLAMQRMMATRVPQLLLKQAKGLLFGTKSSIPKGLLTAMTVLLSTLMVTGGIAGYNYQRLNSKPLARYKAHKKGVETYAKARQLLNAVETKPLSDDIITLLNKNVDSSTPAKVNEDPMKELLV